MALITCALDEILNPAICNGRGGIARIAWFDVGSVDWDAMAVDPLKFDPLNQTILGYTMTAGATMKQITFERKSAYYEFTYTDETGVYTDFLTFNFRGKDAARRNKLMSAIQCCNIGIHIYGNGGEQRVFGIDWNGEDFLGLLEQGRLLRHLDAGGQLGTSVARDEIDLGGESLFAPLFANVPFASLPLA